MTQAATTTSFSAARGAPAAAPVVVCERLTKVFRDFWLRPRAKAVNAVSFEIRRGEVFGLLGPNGSGKSTTIKIILGLLHKTSGLVSVFGKLPTDVSIKQRIGYLPEESYLYPFLNAGNAGLLRSPVPTRPRRCGSVVLMNCWTWSGWRRAVPPGAQYSRACSGIGIAQRSSTIPSFSSSMSRPPVWTRWAHDRSRTDHRAGPSRQDHPALQPPAVGCRGLCRPHGHPLRRAHPARGHVRRVARDAGRHRSRDRSARRGDHQRDRPADPGAQRRGPESGPRRTAAPETRGPLRADCR